jgi:[protein-PII] uridylyltransferase
VIGSDEATFVARRTAGALRVAGAGPSAERISEAPPGYLVAHGSSDIARQCALLTPAPAEREVRVVTTPGRNVGEWHLDVGARDRPGLLASCTGVLARREIDVVQAVLATWDDGAALEAFIVRSDHPPDTAQLQVAFTSALGGGLWSPPLPDASIEFDHDLSSLYTACEVRAADRPGLLHAIAVAFAAAGADVHAASVMTVDGVACDRFDLSDGAGSKLDGDLEQAIIELVQGGVRTLTPGRARRH